MRGSVMGCYKGVIRYGVFDFSLLVYGVLLYTERAIWYGLGQMIIIVVKNRRIRVVGRMSGSVV